jgi:hypothetical protein
MPRNVRYLLNALLLLALGAHGVYRFAVGRAELASDTLGLVLVVAQVVVGFAGAIWFFVRSRSVSS